MNKVVLVGNLTKDPELIYTNSGIALCKFTLAISRKFLNSEGVREADFLPIVVWRNQAEQCNKYLKKGSKAAVAGAIQTRSYEANDGTRRYITEINADEVQFLSSRNDYVDNKNEDNNNNNKNDDADVFDDLQAVDENLPF